MEKVFNVKLFQLLHVCITIVMAHGHEFWHQDLVPCSYSYFYIHGSIKYVFIIKLPCLRVVCMCIVQYDDDLSHAIRDQTAPLLFLNCFCCFVNCFHPQGSRRHMHCLCIIWCVWFCQMMSCLCSSLTQGMKVRYNFPKVLYILLFCMLIF